MIAPRKIICLSCKNEFIKGCVGPGTLGYCEICSKNIFEGHLTKEEFVFVLNKAIAKLGGNLDILSEFLEVSISLIEHWIEGNSPSSAYTSRVLVERMKLLGIDE